MSIVASLLITFGEDVASSAVAIIEADPLRNVQSDGEAKTQFSPRDSYYFLIHHETTLRIDSLKSTAGMIVAEGSVSQDRTNEIFFTDFTTEHTLTYIPNGGITAEWYWRAGGGLVKVNKNQAIISSGVLPVEGLISYSVPFNQYKLLTPDVILDEGESKKITIVANMVNA